MLCLTTQYLRSFKVNDTAFSTLNCRGKADKSIKLNPILLKNHKIEYFNSIINKKNHYQNFKIFSSIMMRDTGLYWLLIILLFILKKM